jgi:hypothetical protein
MLSRRLYSIRSRKQEKGAGQLFPGDWSNATFPARAVFNIVQFPDA